LVEAPPAIPRLATVPHVWHASTTSIQGVPTVRAGDPRRRIRHDAAVVEVLADEVGLCSNHGRVVIGCALIR
jgi:hypothetical protein